MKRWEAVLATLPSWAVDLALGVALALVNLAAIVPSRSQLHPFALAVGLVVLQAVPLVWRRSAPVATFVLVGAARVAYDSVGLTMAPLPLGPAIAVYTVADRCSAPTRRVLGLLVAAGVIGSQLSPGHNEPYDGISAGLTMLAAWVAGALGRSRRRHAQETEARAARAEAGAAQEREQIARDLHDIVAHHVSLMAVQSEAALALLPERPEQAARSVEVIASTARQALSELRQLLRVLRRHPEPPGTEPTPSLATIGTLVERVKAAGLSVGMEVTGEPCPLSPLVETNVYRIVQEALTNSLRHARGAKTSVVLAYEPGYLTVSVTDSGASDARPNVDRPNIDRPNGTSAGASRIVGGLEGSGNGLAGIAERVSSCGGTLSAGPKGGGFVVVGRLPAQ